MTSCLHTIFSIPDIVGIVYTFLGNPLYGMTILDVLIMLGIQQEEYLENANIKLSIHGIREIILNQNPLNILNWLYQYHLPSLSTWYDYITVIFMELIELDSVQHSAHDYLHIISWLQDVFVKSDNKWNEHLMRALHYSLEYGNVFFATIIYNIIKENQIIIPRQTMIFVLTRDHLNSLLWIENHSCIIEKWDWKKSCHLSVACYSKTIDYWNTKIDRFNIS